MESRVHADEVRSGRITYATKVLTEKVNNY
jgi:hypothetical protein